MKVKTAGVLLAGLALRLVLFQRFPFLSRVLDGRVECSTPVSSFKRLEEGLFQYLHGGSPYHGGVFHQSPLLLGLFAIIHNYISPEIWVINAFYSLIDTLIGYGFARIAAIDYLVSYDPTVVCAIYLFNPFTLLSTLSRSTLIFTNLTTALSILAAVNKKSIQAVSILALSSCLSIYPIYLAPALIVLCKERSPQSKISSSYYKLGSLFVLFIGIFLYMSYNTIHNSWEFIESTYGVILLLTELTPNIGLWWYFFTEMFDYFRPFFLGVFQIYCAAYSLPVTIRLRKYPIFALTTVVGLTTLFKPYPEVGDIGFYFTLLLLYKPVFSRKYKPANYFL